MWPLPEHPAPVHLVHALLLGGVGLALFGAASLLLASTHALERAGRALVWCWGWLRKRCSRKNRPARPAWVSYYDRDSGHS